RTPMQWNDRPNAGFADEDAPEERLYSPVIDDATYGYKTVNVAAQEDDPDSLLNWTRTALRVRKAHSVFGRGELTVLKPDNGAVLAYVRSNADERILVVNNLSPDPQQVTLKLDAGEGVELEDLFTGEKLDRTDSDVESLSLAGYEYRWLKLVP
ncbi:MAG: alpha-glucosidase C-terminal domain-containing protein, partial [Anaerolineae bacterium]